MNKEERLARQSILRNIISLEEQDDAKTVAYFTGLAEKYGNDVRTLNWGSKASQKGRFAVLEKIGNLNKKSVLDVGCGLGDFYGWQIGRAHV